MRGPGPHEDRNTAIDEQTPASSSGYWYAPGPAGADPVEVLTLLRRYRKAERRMRARTRDAMGMGETDLAALRLLLQADRAGRPMRQRDLAEALEITPASASVLVDRLVREGYARREPHPQDRRSVIVQVTARTDEDVRATLGGMHRTMLAAVEDLTPDERAVVARFLTALIHSLEGPAEGPDA